MVPPASRRPFALLGTGSLTGAVADESRFSPARFILPWIGLSLVVHAVLVTMGMLVPVQPIERGAPVPEWAVALTLPQETPTDVELPPSPPEARSPQMQTSTEPVEPPAPPPALRSPPGVNGSSLFDGLLGPLVGPALPGPPPSLDGRRFSAAELLRPQHRDTRLFRPLPENIVALSDAQKAQLELNIAIAEISDSIAILAASGRRATDWTYTDKQGRKWGISPGALGGAQLNLGDVVIPLPLAFRTPMSAEAVRLAWQYQDIENHADRAEALAVLRDRAAEIRRRRDAERVARGQGQGKAAPRPAQADTSAPSVR